MDINTSLAHHIIYHFKGFSLHVYLPEKTLEKLGSFSKTFGHCQ